MRRTILKASFFSICGAIRIYYLELNSRIFFIAVNYSVESCIHCVELYSSKFYLLLELSSWKFFIYYLQLSRSLVFNGVEHFFLETWIILDPIYSKPAWVILSFFLNSLFWRSNLSLFIRCYAAFLGKWNSMSKS